MVKSRMLGLEPSVYSHCIGSELSLTLGDNNSLNGLICLHSVLDKAGSQSVFKRT